MTVAPEPARRRAPSLRLLLPFVLVSFAANSLITRHVVAARLMDPGLLSAARFIAGAVALVAIAFARRDRPRLRVGRANVMPAAWLGVYALCISYGYHYIGAAAGTFVFYTAVLLTLVAHDVATGTGVQASRVVGVVVALSGIAVLALGSDGRVTALGVLLLAGTGVSWGLYTVAGRSGGDPRVATTGNFVVVAAVVVAPAAVGAAVGLRLTVAGVVWAVVMGALTTALAYVAWYACQRSMTGTAAGTAQLAVPVLTAIGAVALLGEQVSVTLLVAAVLVATGLWLGRPGTRPVRDSHP